MNSGLCSVVPAVPEMMKPLQDSQLFDAECSEPLLKSNESSPVTHNGLLNSHTRPEVSAPPRATRSTGSRHRLRGTEKNVLFEVRSHFTIIFCYFAHF